jgi:hypothetical protein
MKMPKFQKFENTRKPYRGGGSRMFATLSGDNRHATLTLGAYIRDAGFNPDQLYMFLWDADEMIIGLAPSERGFKVRRIENHNHTSETFTIEARGFCSQFNIRERLECFTFEIKNDTWLLSMRKKLA